MKQLRKYFTLLIVSCLMLGALGIKSALAVEITAIDFNGDLIGKVIPNGQVVSYDNQLIGNVTADSLIVDFNGKLIGGVVPQGIAVGNDNKVWSLMIILMLSALFCFRDWFIPMTEERSDA